jgi:hypothetical protein
MIRPGDAGSSWRGRHAAVNAAIRAASHHIDPQHIRHKLCGGSLNAVGVFAGRHKGGVKHYRSVWIDRTSMGSTSYPASVSPSGA